MKSILVCAGLLPCLFNVALSNHAISNEYSASNYYASSAFQNFSKNQNAPWANHVKDCTVRDKSFERMRFIPTGTDLTCLAQAFLELVNEKEVDFCRYAPIAATLIAWKVVTKLDNGTFSIPARIVELAKEYITLVFNVPLDILEKWLKGPAVQRRAENLFSEGYEKLFAPDLAQIFGFEEWNTLPEIPIRCSELMRCFFLIQGMIFDRMSCSDDCKVKLQKTINGYWENEKGPSIDLVSDIKALRRFVEKVQHFAKAFPNPNLWRKVLHHAVKNHGFLILADSLLPYSWFQHVAINSMKALNDKMSRGLIGSTPLKKEYIEFLRQRATSSQVLNDILKYGEFSEKAIDSFAVNEINHLRELGCTRFFELFIAYLDEKDHKFLMKEVIGSRFQVNGHLTTLHDCREAVRSSLHQSLVTYEERLQPYMDQIAKFDVTAISVRMVGIQKERKDLDCEDYMMEDWKSKDQATRDSAFEDYMMEDLDGEDHLMEALDNEDHVMNDFGNGDAVLENLGNDDDTMRDPVSGDQAMKNPKSKDGANNGPHCQALALELLKAVAELNRQYANLYDNKKKLLELLY